MTSLERTPEPLQALAARAASANLSIIDEVSASSEVKQLYAQFRLDFDRPRVPGILQCFATHPPLLTHMMALAREMLFVEGALGRQNKELISAFVSASNSCEYCSDSHAHSFELQGGTRAVTEATLACDLDSLALTEPQRMLLVFAHKITHNSHALTPADVERMRTGGWNDLQIAEAIHITALFAAFNRVVNAFGLSSQNLLQGLKEEVTHGR